MKKSNLFYLLLILCFLFSPNFIGAQGIIATSSNELITVDPFGNSTANAPNVGISVINPNANLDVECAPAVGLSNLRFRNLQTSDDTMMLVHDANGYVYSRPFTSGTGGGNFWRLNGNTVTATDFIGTLNNFDMNFRTNNLLRMFLTTNGDLSVGPSNTVLGRMNLAVGASNTIAATSSLNTVSGATNNVNGWSCLAAGQTNTIGLTGGGLVAKSVALGWNNRSQNHNQYLIGAANSATQEYSGVLGVGLNVTARGAWYLGGNSGTGLTNGLTNSLAIGWGNQHTALFDGSGLALGYAAIGNTTARLDVFAPGFDGFPSGVRFNQLPVGQGNILVIDRDGGGGPDYVYDSGINIQEVLFLVQNGGATDGAKSNAELQSQIDDLTQKVEALMALTETLKATSSTKPQFQSSLEVYPNPTSGELTVKHFIPENTKQAQLLFVDLGGKEISKVNIDCFGECTSTVQLPDFLNSGTYYCSLLINDTLINTKTISYVK